MSSPRRQLIRAAVIAGVLVLFDQLSKRWALQSLTEGADPRRVLGPLHFTLHFNSGMAFSRGRGMGRIIGLLAIVVAGVLLATLRRVRGPLAVVAVGLVAGGAIGNVLDRVFRSTAGFMQGRVIDFIDLRFWPIFNIADSGVVVGAVLLIIDSWRADRRRANAAAAESTLTNATEPT
jgi:signal peptidase II